MTSQLFRQQVIEQQQTNRYGSVMIINPLSFKVLTLLTSLIILALISFAVWGQYTRKHTVTGFLSPTSGLITLYASTAGIVKDLDVTQEQGFSVGTELLSSAPVKYSFH